MSNERYQKKHKEEVQPLKASEEQKISFDLYFQKLMSKRKGILAHHKAPMRKFAEQQLGVSEATEKAFEEIFKSY